MKPHSPAILKAALAVVLTAALAAAQDAPAEMARADLANADAVIALWKRADPNQGLQLLKVHEALQLELTDEGECEFPSFSPDGQKLCLTVSSDNSGRRASALRIMSLERLEKARPRLLEVQSRSETALPIMGMGKQTAFRSHDSQVYFNWTEASGYVYYSRVHEKIYRGAFSASAASVTADVLARAAAITMHGARSAVYYQDLRGINLAASSAASQEIVQIARTRIEGDAVELATMPAVCPSNPGVIAFIARLRGAPSTDLCVRFADGSLTRLQTAQGWEKLPSWSPDGEHIAFYSTRTNPRANEYGVWAVRVDQRSRSLGALFNVSGDDQISPHDLRDARRTGGPAWTPSGNQILYFAKDRRGTTEQEDYYMLKSYDIRYGEDEGALQVAMPEGVNLNSPGDLSCNPDGALIAFSNAVTKESARNYRIVLLRTNLAGRSER